MLEYKWWGLLVTACIWVCMAPVTAQISPLSEVKEGMESMLDPFRDAMKKTWTFAVGRDFLPYEYVTDGGTLMGAYSSVIAGVCGWALVKCEIVAVKNYSLIWDNEKQFSKGLSEGYFDAAVGWLNTQDRNLMYEFAVPLFKTPKYALYQRAGANIRDLDLENQRIGFVSAWFLSPSCLEINFKREVKDKMYATSFAMLREALENGVIDLALMEEGPDTEGLDIMDPGKPFQCEKGPPSLMFRKEMVGHFQWFQDSMDLLVDASGHYDQICQQQADAYGLNLDSCLDRTLNKETFDGSLTDFGYSFGPPPPEYKKTFLFGVGNNNAPFEYVDKDAGMVGFNVDLINAVCMEMDMQCDFVYTHSYSLTWDADTQESYGLWRNHYDAGFGWMKTEERNMILGFSQPVLNVQKYGLYKVAGSSVSNFEPDTQKIGFAVAWYLTPSCLEKHLNVEVKNVNYRNDMQELKQALIDGQLDLAFMEYNIHLMDGLEEVVLDKEVQCELAGPALMFRKENADMFLWFDEGVQRIKNNGRYQEACLNSHIHGSDISDTCDGGIAPIASYMMGTLTSDMHMVADVESNKTYLIAVTDNNLPFEYEDESMVQGFNVDLVKAACKVMDKACEFFFVKDKELMWNKEESMSQGLWDNYFDGLLTFPTYEMSLSYGFVGGYLTPPEYYLFTRKGANLQLLDFENHKFGFLEGHEYLNPSCLMRNFGVHKIPNVMYRQTEGQLGFLLQTRQIDVALMPDMTYFSGGTPTNSVEWRDLLRIEVFNPGQDFQCEAGPAGMMVRKENLENMAWFDEGIQKLQRNGQMAKLCAGTHDLHLGYQLKKYCKDAVEMVQAGLNMW